MRRCGRLRTGPCLSLSAVRPRQPLLTVPSPSARSYFSALSAAAPTAARPRRRRAYPNIPMRSFCAGTEQRTGLKSSSPRFSSTSRNSEQIMTVIDAVRPKLTSKLTSAKLDTLMLAAYATAVLVRMPDIVIKRRFWAEEGEVYFHNAWNERWYDALFAVHSGYLNLSASIATLLATYLVPLEFAPLASTSFALFVQLCPAFLLITGCVEWLRNRVTLTLALLLLLACNNTGEVWLNSINSQHHLGLCAALILALPTVGGWLGAFRVGLLVLAALSGPASISLTPLFFLRAWLDRSRARLIQGGLLAVFGGLQVLMVALHPDPGRAIRDWAEIAHSCSVHQALD